MVTFAIFLYSSMRCPPSHREVCRVLLGMSNEPVDQQPSSTAINFETKREGVSDQQAYADPGPLPSSRCLDRSSRIDGGFACPGHEASGTRLYPSRQLAPIKAPLAIPSSLPSPIPLRNLPSQHCVSIKTPISQSAHHSRKPSGKRTFSRTTRVASSPPRSSASAPMTANSVCA